MSDGLLINGQMIDCEKSILSEQAALRLGSARGGGAPPLPPPRTFHHSDEVRVVWRSVKCQKDIRHDIGR